MTCDQCCGIERLFDEETAESDLRDYLSKGPAKTTNRLVAALIAQGVEGASLLDIGGGVGAIQYELLVNGVASATSVEASSAYSRMAQKAAESRGLAERVMHLHGNFVDLGGQLEPADIVTLDRVICCYHDVANLVGRSASLARRLYGVVYPRSVFWTKLFARAANAALWIGRSPFRGYVHPTEAVESIIRSAGLTRVFYDRGFFWQVAVYSR